jgi:hypothetical protein
VTPLLLPPYSLRYLFVSFYTWQSLINTEIYKTRHKNDSEWKELGGVGSPESQSLNFSGFSFFSCDENLNKAHTALLTTRGLACCLEHQELAQYLSVPACYSARHTSFPFKHLPATRTQLLPDRIRH